MRVFYSAQYLDYSDRLVLISIGLVREDGRTYYAVNRGLSARHVLADPSLRAAAWPYLPTRDDTLLDRSHPDVKMRSRIAAEVDAFLAAVPDLELWSWRGAYAHVLLCQLFGTELDLPDAVPDWTNDLRQEAHRLGVDPDELPSQQTRRHHALDNAQHHRIIARCLDAAAVSDPLETPGTPLSQAGR
ncbi:3'-5' exoribonuclease [Kitasatospora sp. NBC_01560]|uniref:3'-5' exoribonuclease domain-containing protein n=1 Tax=Kitasatospora sp. NBC_01560 TaxID=2975965 RepID=UPI00386E4608